LNELSQICQELNIKEVAFPKTENGLDKLDWSQIIHFLHEFLINKGITCHVYTGEREVQVLKNDLKLNDQLKVLQ
jgi:hypothetical protein